MKEVYVAVARYGGMLDDVQVFDSMPIAVAKVRQWADGMEPMFTVSNPEQDVLGEYELDGEVWYFDVLTCPVRSAESEGMALLAELLVADFLPEGAGFEPMAAAVVAEYES